MVRNRSWGPPNVSAAILLVMFTWQLTKADEFPLPPFDDVITLPAELGGKSRVFLLDPGASTVLFHTSLRPHLGSPLRNTSLNAFDASSVPASIFASLQMYVAGKRGLA